MKLLLAIALLSLGGFASAQEFELYKVHECDHERGFGVYKFRNGTFKPSKVIASEICANLDDGEINGAVDILDLVKDKHNSDSMSEFYHNSEYDPFDSGSELKATSDFWHPVMNAYFDPNREINSASRFVQLGIIPNNARVTDGDIVFEGHTIDAAKIDLDIDGTYDVFIYIEAIYSGPDPKKRARAQILGFRGELAMKDGFMSGDIPIGRWPVIDGSVDSEISGSAALELEVGDDGRIRATINAKAHSYGSLNLGYDEPWGEIHIKSLQFVGYAFGDTLTMIKARSYGSGEIYGHPTGKDVWGDVIVGAYLKD